MGDEELASTGILAGVRHAQSAGAVFVGIEVRLTLDLVARPPGADPRVPRFPGQRVASLDHEVRDDAVKSGPVIELAVGQLLEVADSARHFSVEQFRLDGAFARLDSRALRHGHPLGRLVL